MHRPTKAKILHKRSEAIVRIARLCTGIREYHAYRSVTLSAELFAIANLVTVVRFSVTLASIRGQTTLLT